MDRLARVATALSLWSALGACDGEPPEARLAVAPQAICGSAGCACSADSDCDDLNECTVDWCKTNGPASQRGCHFDPAPDETPCTGGTCLAAQCVTSECTPNCGAQACGADDGCGGECGFPCGLATATFHLHKESSPTAFAWYLKPTGPDSALFLNQWSIPSFYGPGDDDYLSAWETAPTVPNQTGVIFAGSTITFTLWMRKTSKWGVQYPGAALNLNFNWFSQPVHVTQVCKSFSTEPLTQTLQEYTFTCTVPRSTTVRPTDRFVVWPHYLVGESVGNHATSIELGMEGTLNGTGDSRAIIPVATPAPSTSNCPGADPTDSLPDDDALNACLDAGGVVVLASAATDPGYIIDNGLVLTQDSTTLISSSIDTKLVAGPNLRAPMLTVVDGVAFYSISHLTFDGNRSARATYDCRDATSRENGYNMKLRGTDFIVEWIRSQNALCGSGMEVDGIGYYIRNNELNDNGFEESEGVPGGSADGLTLTTCRGSVYENQFADNTNVDLLVGPTDPVPPDYYYCRVEDNTITHANRYGNVGLMVGLGGDHYNSSVYTNTVTSGLDKLGFGILVGHHPFAASVETASVGNIAGNTTTGAVVPLAVDGIASGSVTSNTATGAQGSNGFGQCTLSADYTAADFGAATVQAGYVARDYHNGCTPDVLLPGECLEAGQSRRSADGSAELIYQGDSNLVLYHDGVAVFASSTVGYSNGDACMQGDGNFVVYDGGGVPRWSTDTWGNPGAYLKVLDDGTFVIYDASDVPLWASAPPSEYSGIAVPIAVPPVSCSSAQFPVTNGVAYLFTSPDCIYDKPIVVPQEFDIGEVQRGQLPINNYFGPRAPILQPMLDQGYDLWIVMPDATGTDIFDQAAGFAQGVQMASNYLGYDERVAVLGFSLGGIVARISLAYWEDSASWRSSLGLATASAPVRKVLFLDAPLEGANVSRKLQKVLVDKDLAADNNLTSCAAQQLLVESEIAFPEYHANWERFFVTGGTLQRRLMYNIPAPICDGPPVPVFSINGDGWPHDPEIDIVLVSFGNSADTVGCYGPGDSRDVNSLGERVCDFVRTKQEFSEYARLQISFAPDIHVHGTWWDAQPGSRLMISMNAFAEASNAGFFIFRLTGAVQYWSPTFIPFTSAWASYSGGGQFERIQGSYSALHDSPETSIMTAVFTHLALAFSGG